MLIKLIKHDGFPFLKFIDKDAILQAEFCTMNYPNPYSISYDELRRNGVPAEEILEVGRFSAFYFPYDEVIEIRPYKSILATLEKMREQSNTKN